MLAMLGPYWRPQNQNGRPDTAQRKSAARNLAMSWSTVTVTLAGRRPLDARSASRRRALLRLLAVRLRSRRSSSERGVLGADVARRVAQALSAAALRRS